MHSREEDTFTCEICSYECKTLNQILHHQNAHNSENVFICTKFDYRTIKHILKSVIENVSRMSSRNALEM